MSLRLTLSVTVASLALLGGAVAIAASAERLARLNVEETTLSAEQAQNMSQLSRLLSVLEQIRRDPPPALLVNPKDAKAAVRAAILVKAMTPQLQARARTYAHEASEMMRQRRLAAVESETLFTDDSERAETTPLPSGPAERRDPAPAIAISPPQSLINPVNGSIVRKFGEALSSGGHANGLTLATGSGATVNAPGAGTVQYVGPIKGWGVILILRLAGGYHLVLAGLDRTSATVGEPVVAGQAVGWMPKSGAGDGKQGSELYLEVREQGVPVDPARWLKSNAG